MITILPQTDKEPLNTIGYCAGICWNSPVEDKEKNIKRAKSCIQSGHTRTAEYPDVFCIIEGYSARCIRELYTHIVGTTRLQSSTRYVDAKNMNVDKEFYSPFKGEAENIYKGALKNIMEAYTKIEEEGYAKEDAANILPLGMETKIVWKINLRALMHFMNMRLCTRAYKEIRALSVELKEKLKVLSPEWEWICENLFVPKCEANGYCDEDHSCGKMISKKEMLQAVEAWKNKK
ncbi:MAG: FAD-dependent thymidylate synthase [Treponema sp.]|uniref:FAD-dependent thymidylate synthase n=1 Tax=Treponema sp. TaxID=166 RepID=UPI00298D6889|nr:FAD-dependent thymidylate synthase [Treponema sp.]MBR5933871.1 FAD-dependent thymidylate synthase [Treponema sp.]